MKDNKRTSPAQRLLEILRKAQRPTEKTPSRVAWGHIFDLEPEDTRGLLHALADLIRLVDEARDELQELKDLDADLYLRPFDQVQRAFVQINLQANWQSFKQYLDPATMTALEFCADTLNRARGEAVIDQTELDDLLRGVSELIKDVRHSSLDEELKMVLLENLQRIERAILSYELLGARGLRDVSESALGSLFIVRDKLREASDREGGGGGIVRRFFEQIDHLNKLIALARGIRAISSPIIKLLGGPAGGMEN